MKTLIDNVIKIFLPFSLTAIDQLCVYFKLLKDLVDPIFTWNCVGVSDFNNFKVKDMVT